MDARRGPDIAKMIEGQIVPGSPRWYMVIRQERNQQQNQQRQQHQQNQQQQGDTGGREAPAPQIDLVRAESFASHRGKILNLRSEMPIQVNKKQSDDENAHPIGRRKIMVGGKRSQRFAPDLRRKNFNASW